MESRPWGFRVSNTFKSFQFVSELYALLQSKNVFKKVLQLFKRIKSGEYDKETEQENLTNLDAEITDAMLQAEDKIRPSPIATSHVWSPELVRAQKKANLMHGAAHWVQRRGHLEGAKLTRFREQARTIDPSWSPPLNSNDEIIAGALLTRKEARIATKKQRELRLKHLDEQLEEALQLGSDEHREKSIKMIKRNETMRATHRRAKAAVKPRAPAVTYVEKDGIRLSGKDVNEAFVEHNQQHFLQPIANGASAAIPGQVRDDLRPYDEEGNMTRQDAAHENYYSILEGEYDTGKVKESKRAFYHNLKRVADTDTKTASSINT